ncbi:MAG: prepilin-type N-terminal cleavage/methylation domain-containing protein [Cloacibacillus sp.]
MDKGHGFTLVEVLITLAIIGILASLGFVSFGKATDRAGDTVCLANRKTIMRAYEIDKNSKRPAPDLKAFVAASYDNMIDNEKARCPAGGVYSASRDAVTSREIVVCSLPRHNDGVAPDGGLSANKTWEEAVKNGLKPGYIFEKDGIYYVATESSDVYPVEQLSGKTPEDIALAHQGDFGGLVKFDESKNQKINWNEVGDSLVLYRGDILIYNGKSYICNMPKHIPPAETDKLEIVKGSLKGQDPANLAGLYEIP